MISIAFREGKNGARRGVSNYLSIVYFVLKVIINRSNLFLLVYLFACGKKKKKKGKKGRRRRRR